MVALKQQAQVALLCSQGLLVQVDLQALLLAQEGHQECPQAHQWIPMLLPVQLLWIPVQRLLAHLWTLLLEVLQALRQWILQPVDLLLWIRMLALLPLILPLLVCLRWMLHHLPMTKV